MVACFLDEVEMREYIIITREYHVKMRSDSAVVGGRVKQMNNIWVGLCLMGSVQRVNHRVKRAKSCQFFSLL